MIAVEWPLTRAAVGVVGDTACDGDGWRRTPTSQRLDALKQRVPAAKAARGQKAWDAIISTPLPSLLYDRGGTRKASRAYYKMREMTLSCALEPPRHSVHLCEAPGGFVQAVAEGRPPRIHTGEGGTGWNWLAVSLPPPAPDERRARPPPTPSWDLLPMAEGRFLELDVFDAVACAAHLPQDAADLVTADGAVDMNHDQIEEGHFPLLVAQTRWMLWCAREGATFVCKFFEGSEYCTLSVLAFLTQRFRCVSVIKPTSSRSTNSERYVVCRGFHRHPPSPEVLAMAALETRNLRVCAEWITETRAVLDGISSTQADALEKALRATKR